MGSVTLENNLTDNCGSGEGYGDGSGDGYGSGWGDGDGEGYGDGDGDGDGDGTCLYEIGAHFVEEEKKNDA